MKEVAVPGRNGGGDINGGVFIKGGGVSGEFMKGGGGGGCMNGGGIPLSP